MLMKHLQSGMSLIEAMVAIVILGTGLLGLAAMQGRALAMAQSAQYRSVAADLAANLAERIRANRSPFILMSDGKLLPELAKALPPNFSKCAPPTTNPYTTPCTASGLKEVGTNFERKAYRAPSEMSEWIASLGSSQLPGANFTLTALPITAPLAPPETGDVVWRYRYTLTITWADNRKTGGASPEDFSYTTVIE